MSKKKNGDVMAITFVLLRDRHSASTMDLWVEASGFITHFWAGH
jgi:hypothetical protein